MGRGGRCVRWGSPIRLELPWLLKTHVISSDKTNADNVADSSLLALLRKDLKVQKHQRYYTNRSDCITSPHNALNSLLSSKSCDVSR